MCNSLCNPYSFEIDKVKPTLTKINGLIETPKSITETPFKYIEYLEDLKWLCQFLGKSNRSNVKEIGVDLEYHSLRSYLGFTCLIQISTRTHDFIIDAIKLRSEIHILNEIFSDPTLIKVMHGSSGTDLFWLQKDFGIYTVNVRTCVFN